ncbi:MAG TPA: MlaD family protein [Rhodopila sp.]|nr:MlaD family protein [Rhodopila sp.]
MPIAALAIVAYLTFQQFAQRGPSVTVIFPTADIKADSTKVKYEGMEVGQVESVTFYKDIKHLKAVLRLHADMAGHLGKGTRFWLAGNKPSFSNLSALKSIISGPYIGIEPHSGKRQDQYQGLPQRPVNANDPQGTHYLLRTAKLGNIDRGSVLFYRGLQVGEVEAKHLDKDQIHFIVDLFVHAPFDHLIRTNTRFWNAGAVQVSMADEGPKLQLQSVPALLEGAVGFETPDGPESGSAAKPDALFPLYDSRGAAEHAPDKRAVRYQVVFGAQEAGGLQAGAPVTLADKRVGSVTESRLQYDPSDGQLNTVATLAIEPDTIDLADGVAWAEDAKPQMDALLRHLIAQGLRARLGSKIPMVGAKGVQLAFMPKAASASLGSQAVPEIPTGPASDISGLMAQVNAVAAKIDAMPIDQIADEVHQTTKRLAAFSKSPELTQSLTRLDQSLTNIEHVTHEASRQTGPLLTELRRTATQAQSTLTAARGLVGTSAVQTTAPGTASMGDTLYELSRAARSLRALADYLDRHPEALLRGKGGPS